MTTFHFFWTHKSYLLLGIKGVNGVAPLVAYNLSHLAEPLLLLTSADMIKEMELPLITQFLNCVADSSSAKNILGLKGNSGIKAIKATGLALFIIISLPKLETIMKVAGPAESTRLGIKSITMLKGLMEFASLVSQAK